MADPIYCSPPFTEFVCLPLAWEGVWGAIVGLANILVVIYIAKLSHAQVRRAEEDRRLEGERIKEERRREREQAFRGHLQAALIELTGLYRLVGAVHKHDAILPPLSSVELLEPHYGDDPDLTRIVGEAVQAWKRKQANPSDATPRTVKPFMEAIVFLAGRLEMLGVAVPANSVEIVEQYRRQNPPTAS